MKQRKQLTVIFKQQKLSIQKCEIMPGQWTELNKLKY